MRAPAASDLVLEREHVGVAQTGHLEDVGIHRDRGASTLRMVHLSLHSGLSPELILGSHDRTNDAARAAHGLSSLEGRLLHLRCVEGVNGGVARDTVGRVGRVGADHVTGVESDSVDLGLLGALVAVGHRTLGQHAQVHAVLVVDAGETKQREKKESQI